MRIALAVDDRYLPLQDLRDVRHGNPGIAGTPYLVIALADKLSEIIGSRGCLLFHRNPASMFPDRLTKQCYCDELDFGDRLADYGVTHLIITGVVNPDADPVYRFLRTARSDVKVFVWLHNHFGNKVISKYCQLPGFQSVVFCGHEQGRLACDSLAAFCSTAIPNLYYHPQEVSALPRDPNAVVFVGNIIPTKGLHRLLRIWPEVLNDVTQARLHVIGNGSLYGRKGEFGPRNISDKNYESLLFSYLQDSGTVESVRFHGHLGHEKFAIMQSSSVGISNPTGLSECCPGSTMEMSACGCAMLGPRRWGAIDTIVDGHTGLLYATDAQFRLLIVRFLRTPRLASALGANGRYHVPRYFSPDRIAAMWLQLLHGDMRQTNLGLPRGRYPYRAIMASNMVGRSTVCYSLRRGMEKVHNWYCRRR
jgi:glycosyltransferase involved in cell wall biosynthesis